MLISLDKLQSYQTGKMNNKKTGGKSNINIYKVGGGVIMGGFK